MKHFSDCVSVFHNRVVPEQGAMLAGYAALIYVFELIVPVPEVCAIISRRHMRSVRDGWAIYTPRHKPADTLRAHLIFALKYEGVDLGVLHALFEKISPGEIAAWVQDEPVSKYARRIWFLYEWLMGQHLDLPDARTGNFVPVLDSRLQYPGPARSSRRHRVQNNLPGVPDFCPMVRCTPVLEAFRAQKLASVARRLVAHTSEMLLARAASFLLLKDSRASFAIEQEYPERERLERWGQVVLAAFTQEELVRLQAELLAGNRFIRTGLRTEGGFVGVHDRAGTPFPDHISARVEDLERLLEGLIATYALLQESAYDPVVLATVIAFGFVFIHPFVDGNGRIHRYLIQYVLAQTGFVPERMVIPVSTVILKHMNSYKHVLESYSQPRLACISWRATPTGNIEVLNATIDLYRYFDATRQAEFLYRCVEEALTHALPQEVAYLAWYDRLKLVIKEDFPALHESTVRLLLHFLQQGQGRLSKRARSREFKMLSPTECNSIEALYARVGGPPHVEHE